MRFFLDTEFNEDFHKPLFGRRRHFIDLISIGIVGEDGREFYAVSSEFDVKAAWNKWQLKLVLSNEPSELEAQREYWLRDNVLKGVWDGLLKQYQGSPYWMQDDWQEQRETEQFTLQSLKRLVRLFGMSRRQIAMTITEFCRTIFVSVDSVPEGVSRIKHSLAPPEFWGYYCDYDWVAFCALFGTMMNLPEGFPMYCRDLKQSLDEAVASMAAAAKESFDVALARRKKMDTYPAQVHEHNALHDARWNQALYNHIAAPWLHRYKEAYKELWDLDGTVTLTYTGEYFRRILSGLDCYLPFSELTPISGGEPPVYKPGDRLLFPEEGQSCLIAKVDGSYICFRVEDHRFNISLTQGDHILYIPGNGD